MIRLYKYVSNSFSPLRPVPITKSWSNLSSVSILCSVYGLLVKDCITISFCPVCNGCRALTKSPVVLISYCLLLILVGLIKKIGSSWFIKNNYIFNLWVIA